MAGVLGTGFDEDATAFTCMGAWVAYTTGDMQSILAFRLPRVDRLAILVFLHRSGCNTRNAANGPGFSAQSFEDTAWRNCLDH